MSNNTQHPHWPADTLALLGTADQIDISSRRADDTLRPFVPIWIVATDTGVYVRSYRGTGGAWYQHITGGDATGVIDVAGRRLEVVFTPADPGHRADIDTAYRTKYARYDTSYLPPMLAEQAAATTLRIDPRQ